MGILSSKFAARESEKENRSHARLLDGLTAIIIILAAAFTIYAAVWLLPTMLHAILQEFGAYFDPKPRG